MKLKLLFVLVACCLALVACRDDESDRFTRGGSSTPPPGAVETGPFKLLLYTRTGGFRHTSIPFAIEAIRGLGSEHDFTVDATEDPNAFTDENLTQYRVVAFVNTTGEILDDAQQRAMERFVAAGGGFVGVHSAADTEYEWPFYARLIGAYFRNHPIQQLGVFVNEAPDHPSTAHLPERWLIFDEFYSFRASPREQVRVLLSIDESTYLQDPNTSNLPTPEGEFQEGETGTMGDHPMSWCHDNLGGRAWYTELGHSEYLYVLPDYLQHLAQGILTAARRVEADCATR